MKIIDELKLKKVYAKFGHDILDEPALFVADYASYNEGFICGTWMDVSKFSDHSEFMEHISEFFKELDKCAPLDFFLPREEIMYQDFQCFPKELYYESEIDQTLWDYLDLVEKEGQDKVDAYVHCFGITELDKLEQRFECEVSESGFKNMDEAYGYWCMENGMIEIPAYVEPYFDFEAYGSAMSNDIYEHDGFFFRT